MEVEKSQVSTRRVLMLFCGIVTMDLLVAVHYSHTHALPWQAILSHWDSNWFVNLIENGRGLIRTEVDEPRWAFLPLNLWVVEGAHRLMPSVTVYFAGAMVSFLCTCLALIWMTRKAARAWTPQSIWGWVLWLLAPGSYVFFTFHTEGLFLLLSVLAIGAFFERRLWLICVACLLAVATRNQGTILGLALALAWFWQVEGAARWKSALIVLAVVLGQAGLMTYAHHVAGDAQAFFKAQSHWDHAKNWKEVLGTLVMYFEETPLFKGWWMRTIYAWCWLLTCFAMWKKRVDAAVGIYSFGSFLPMLLQGVFHNVFRFSSVVFSLFFFLGDKLDKTRPVTKAVVLGLWCWLHIWNWTRFVKDVWAY